MVAPISRGSSATRADSSLESLLSVIAAAAAASAAAEVASPVVERSPSAEGPDLTAASSSSASSSSSTVSDRKRAANRANAAKSTGPKTAAGKARVALNAVRHGALAQTPLLPGEDAAEREALAAGFAGDYAPVGPIEGGLVERL